MVQESSWSGDDASASDDTDTGLAVAAARDLVVQQGDPRGRMIGATVFFVGVLVYIHSLWATANNVLRGVSMPEVSVSLLGMEILQGTLGLWLVVLGGAAYGIFMFMPSKTTTNDVWAAARRTALSADVVEIRLMLVRKLKGWGLGVFLVGALITAYTLRWTVMNEFLYNQVIGGVRYRSFHLFGYLLVAAGLILFVPAVLREGPLADLLEAVGGPRDTSSVSEEDSAEDKDDTAAGGVAGGALAAGAGAGWAGSSDEPMKDEEE